VLSSEAEEGSARSHGRVCASTQRHESQRRQETSRRKHGIQVILEKCIDNRTGTDGFRLLCRQFSISSLPHLESCIKSSKTFSLKMKKHREALLLFYTIGGQGRETQQMGSPLQHGRLCCTVFLKRRNLCEKWLRIMVSRMKQYGVLFVLLVAPKRAI